MKKFWMGIALLVVLVVPASRLLAEETERFVVSGTSPYELVTDEKTSLILIKKRGKPINYFGHF